MDQVSKLKEHLKDLHISEMLKNIEEFAKINLKQVNNTDLIRAISKVISIRGEDSFQSHTICRFKLFKNKTRFYRVRKITDLKLPLVDMTYERDAWNPPKEAVRSIGRLNKIYESLLYTSLSPLTATKEAKINDDEIFSLIIYEAKRDIKTVAIGLCQDIPELSEEENMKLRILNSFLYNEFSKDVSSGTEYLYRPSELITKTYFDFPSLFQDAWCYPSIALKGEENICFKPDSARNTLNLVGVVIGSVKRPGSRYFFTPRTMLLDFDENGRFRHQIATGKIFDKTFPEFGIPE